MEWLLAAALAGLVLMALLSVFPTLVSLQHVAQERTTAMCLASEAVERLRATPPGRLATGTDTTAPVTVDGTRYTVETTVTPLKPELVRVDVVVSWTRTFQRHVTLHTQLFRQAAPSPTP